MRAARLVGSISSLILGASLLACGAEAPGDESTAAEDSPFATSPFEPVHEAATAEGLPFLRPEIVLALQAANVSTDVEFHFDAKHHFDNCDFSGASRTVAEHQAEAVRHLGPASPLGDPEAILHFGRSLHAVQDFYAHSNWVELGAENLVDESLSAFLTLSPYATLEPSGFRVVEGDPPKGVALFRKRGAPYPESAIVHYRQGKETGFGLISGSVDYEPGDKCPDQVRMTHDELNKDKSGVGRDAQHLEAKALAVRQTRHEWCRLLTLTRQAHGEAGDARLFAWVENVEEASRCGDPADLSVSLSAGGPAAAGAPATLGLRFENLGPAASYGTGVVVDLPEGLEATEASSSAAACAVESPSRVSCDVGLLESGQAGTATISALADLPGEHEVTASISAHVVDPQPSNDESSATLTVQ